MTYNINALLPIAETIVAAYDSDRPRMASEMFAAHYPALRPLPAYDEWVTAFERLEEDNRRSLISCSKCGKSTTFDSTYGDLCFRCIRAKNE